MSKGTPFISSSRPQISADSGTFRGEKGELDYVGGWGVGVQKDIRENRCGLWRKKEAKGSVGGGVRGL